MGGLGELDDVDEVGFRLAEGVGREPFLDHTPLLLLSRVVCLGHVHGHSLRVNRSLLFHLIVKCLLLLVFLVLHMCSHRCIEEHGLALVTNDHNMVSARINGPTRVHLDHSQVVIDNHAVGHINCVDVATLLEDQGHVFPVWVEH